MPHKQPALMRRIHVDDRLHVGVQAGEFADQVIDRHVLERTSDMVA